MWMGLIFASAFYMIGFEYYLSYFIDFELEFFFIAINTRVIAVLTTAILVAINYFGTKGAGRFQNIIVILLLIILGGFILFGSMHVKGDNLEPFAPNGWGAVAGVAGLVFIGFMGFEVVATVAEEIKQPEKNLWRAMIGSVVVVTILYMAIMIVTTGIVPYDILGKQDTPVTFTTEEFMGGSGGILITVAALLATVSSANASILSASRISLAMGKDRILHPWTNKLHRKFGTPSNSILLTGFFILGFLMIGEVETLAEVAGFMFLMTFILVHGCVMVLRRTRPEWYKPSFRSPLFPFTQIAGAVLCMALIVKMNPTSILLGLGMVGIALVWYRVWSSRKSRVVGEVKKVFEEIKVEEAKKVIQDEEEKHRKILVPFTDVLYEPMKMKI
ncbi:MAG: amino acid permease, partial [Thermoplasmata archaeon]|nr:amino acid permease [Thermoplasmata archaeon]